VNAVELLAALLTPGTFRSWDTDPVDVRPDLAYATDLAQAREKTGRDESVITGEGLVGRRRVAVAASEFGFLGGSIGVAAAERLTRSIERATTERLPMICLPASGGTRIQEGAVAFVQMVKITAAVVAHKSAHLPYLVYLRHPTTGGVFASWGSLGHLTLAEPGALIGFLGPRAHQALSGAQLPEGVQQAESLCAHGLVDTVVAPRDLAAFIESVLTAITAAPRRAPQPDPGVVAAATPAWESVLHTRRADRPRAVDLIRTAFTDVASLRPAPGLILALARIGGYPCVLIAEEGQGPPLGPGALRLARRGVRLAAGLSLPLICVIDTLGAELSAQAELDGLAGEIAGCLADLIAIPVPTIALLLGQGAGGAALALLPADRVLAAQHAWLAPLAPEGASAIVYRDTDRAPELAASQRIRAADLAADRIVDCVIAESSADPERFCRDLGHALHRAIEALANQDDDTRMAERLRRYRSLAVCSK
jgi:acyl-CoA carboxylase subunit beta